MTLHDFFPHTTDRHPFPLVQVSPGRHDFTHATLTQLDGTIGDADARFSCIFHEPEYPLELAPARRPFCPTGTVYLSELAGAYDYMTVDALIELRKSTR